MNNFFLENINNRYKIILIIAFLSLIMLTYFLYSRRKAHKKELDSYRSLMMNYKNEIIKNKQNAESFQNLELELLTKYNLYILNEIKTCAVNFESKPEYYRDKLKNIGKELQYKNNDFWIVLKNIVNEKYNNALIKIQQEFSSVSDEDLKIIAMVFMKFSVTTMGICMGFTNEKSIYQRKKRIAQKMNISESLEDFLVQKMLKKIC